MTTLEDVIATPRLVEIDGVDLALSPARVWEIVRHEDLAGSPLVRMLFKVRTLPERLSGQASAPPTLRIDDLKSTPATPGFQVLCDDHRHELVVGAIGKVWEPRIRFVHVDNAEAFAAFAAPGFVKVAWALRVSPRGEHHARLDLVVRVDATDDGSWQKFKSYFKWIGPGSRFIRRSILGALARKWGTPESRANEEALAGDALLRDAHAQTTDSIEIAAPPAQIWPWLLQMGCGRAGFYSYDVLDNAGRRSAREIHPELQRLRVGDLLPAEPDGPNGFEVLELEEHRVLVLGGLFDAEEGKQRPFASPRPRDFWHVTWAFVLEALDDHTTRLRVRGRAAFSDSQRWHALWIQPVHHFMERAQLRHLAVRAEGRPTRDDTRDVLEGGAGAAVAAVALLTPFLRSARSHWGLSKSLAERRYPGDDLVGEPHWMWTHGIEIAASAEDVWPWIAQIGADRGGFYSYQWLENVAGCQIRNAEAIHPEWAHTAGSALCLHPHMPSLPITELVPNHHMLVFAPADPRARAAGKSWAEVSWLFYLETLGHRRCRLISRYRCATSDDLVTQLQFGEATLEPIGFAMDRRMLIGVKQRSERVVH
jgi:hypothetical protein